MELLELTIPNDVLSGKKSINFVVREGEEVSSLSISDDHPNWSRASEVVEKIKASEVTHNEAAALLHKYVNLVDTVNEKLVKIDNILDGRMAIQGGKIFVDLEPIDAALEAHILKMLNESNTPKDAARWTAFAKFVENLYSNTDAFVREQLFSWIMSQNLYGKGLTLTDDGCFIGYKGCRVIGSVPHSINRGIAVVNGELHEGNIPNPIGATVEMPRGSVQNDPHVGCSTGLHVGTYSYANGFAQGILLTVKVNPRDVVSVPTECNAQKLRACRYVVLESTEVEYDESYYSSRYGSDDYDFDDDEVNEYLDEGEYSPSSLQDLLDHAAKDKNIRFSYNGKERIVRLDQWDKWLIDGNDLLSDGEYRSFRTDRIQYLSDNTVSRVVNIPEVKKPVDIVKDNVNVQDVLESAFVNGTKVSIVYGNSENKPRIITPKQSVKGEELFNAFDHEADDFRTFVISKIVKAEPAV